MTIIPYTNMHKEQMDERMVAYMTELKCDIPEEIIRGKLMDLIDRQCASGVIHADLAIEDTVCIGFSIYQIDSVESDWCKRPGWGFIREFYVIPSFRNHGYGKALAAHTVQQLKSMGAQNLYLTSTEAVPFWQKCGWSRTQTLCSNDQYILEK